jgi:hypothetical protein
MFKLTLLQAKSQSPALGATYSHINSRFQINNETQAHYFSSAILWDHRVYSSLKFKTMKQKTDCEVTYFSMESAKLN